MNRAYSVLTIKEFDDGRRLFSGIATSPTPDRTGDIVEPLGVQFKNPMPLLLFHKTDHPVGSVRFGKPTKNGIPFDAEIAAIDQPGILKDRVDEAWQSVKAKLITAVSIGFRVLNDAVESLKGGGLRFLETEVMELSLVTIPANADASILSIKSIDQAQMRAASGASKVVTLTIPPGASGTKIVGQNGPELFLPKPETPKGTKVKTNKEQIEGFESKRAASDARMSAIMDEAGEAGSTLDETQKQEYDTLAKEVSEIDEHLVRLRAREKAVIASAKPVNGDDPDRATESRGRITMGKSNLAPGIRFARYAMCVAASKGNLMQAEILSRRFNDTTPEVNLVLKAAVAAGTTQDTTWAAPLVQLQEMQAEFIEFLRPQTLLGQLEGRLRHVPFNIKFSRQTAGTTGTFVGEGLPKPLGKMDFDLLSLPFAKAATIIVMTEELMRFSNPSAETLARDDLAAGIARYLDLRFIDPVYAGVANVSPASITNGITAIASTGVTVAAITADIATALKAMAAANINLGGLVWIMNPSVAIDLSLKRTAQDLFAFPNITATGGTFMGYPVIMSNNVALSGSPTEAFVVLLDPSNIMIADDGGVSIDMSNEASLQMSDTPSSSASSMVSLWQSNMVALRAERYIYWKRRRDTAVQLITMNAVW